MESALHLKLPADYDAERIRGFLEGRFAYVVDAPAAQTRSYLDTFDWLLFDRSLVLYAGSDGNGHNLVLHGLDGDTQVSRADTGSAPVFAADLPPGTPYDVVAPAIGARALLALAAIDVRTITYRVLNRDEKTVARLVYTEARPSSKGPNVESAAYLSLLPVRGYAKHARTLAQDLGPGEPVTSVEESLFRNAVSAAGRSPGDYSAKLDLQLDPNMRSDDAAKMILRSLLATLRANENGIRDDIDIEFLHDYRVAIRKTRSALSLLKDVFPADVTERYKQEFRTLGQSTNALRDLDVYLQAEPEYRAMLPEAFRDDIAPLFAHLRSQRAQALAHVIAGVDAPQMRQLLHEWGAFLHESAAGAAGATSAEGPILDFARQRIYRTYRRIVKRGRPLAISAEDEELHALRIDAKKLRYLLEFFASLYPPKELAGLIRELKKLQDNLGEFNDLSVQQAHLIQIASELPLEDAATAKALVATGALVERLAREQDRVRSEFAQSFNDFASNTNRKLYRELFADK